MRHFKDMFRCFREQGITNLQTGKILFPPDDPNTLKWFEECMPFVFTPISEETIDLEADDEAEVNFNCELDSPFTIFSVEMTGNRAVSVDRGTGFGADIVGHVITCVMTIEHHYEYDKMQYVNVFHSKFDNGQEKVLAVIGHMNFIVKQFLDRLGKERVGVDEVEGRCISYKNPKNRKKKVRIPKPVVFIVAPKRYQNTDAGKRVSWTHRFNVRGHWRQVEGIGKDRNGDYCVEGRTWVRESIKGPEDKPLIKKQRVVKD